MKIIIAGSRTFTDYELLRKACDENITSQDEIVSGGARGADLLGERYAKENGITVKRFPADWNKYGRSAGIIRNIEMVKYSDMLIAFWDERSAGTKHIIEIAKKDLLEIKVIDV